MATGMGMKKTDFSADVKKLVKMMFTPGYKFPKQDTDNDFKVHVSENVSFGDINDASCVEPQNELVGGTIIGNICTVRKFFPGQYKLSVIHLYDDNDPLVIFNHEAVDPNLLVMQVLRLSKDYCDFHRDLNNSINRYDWFHWSYYEDSVYNSENDGDSEYNNSEYDSESDLDNKYDGVGDYDEHQVNAEPKSNYAKANYAVMKLLHEEFKSSVTRTVPSLIYFTRAEKAKQLSNLILKNQIRRSSTIKNLFSVQDDDGETVSLGVDFNPFNSGDWVFAKAFEDSASGSYFALVINGYLDLSEEPWKEMYDVKAREELNFSTVAKTELRFPMTEFMFNKN